MKISYNLKEKANNNSILRYDDGSFGCKDGYFDFQVFTQENRSLILNFDVYSKKCLSCEGYLIDECLNKREIKIENAIEGSLKIDLNDDDIFQGYSEYILDKKITYDDSNKMVCFGNVGNIIIKFGIGQYASFYDNKLVGIILEFN